jgi:hypothetical protein
MTSKHILSIILINLNLFFFAQNDSIWNQKPNFNFSGFLDVFYAYDFNQPDGNFRQPFLYNHNRHNEFNINLGLIKLGVEHSKYRANLAIQTGTYANDNYVAEPGLLKTIFEANVGLALNKKNTIWLDAGVFPSHVGFESAISVNNMTLTRSLCAESSPYFLSGAKLTFNPNEKWEIVGLVTNGWQRIKKIEGNSMLSGGTQVNFSPNENVSLNWSTFVGTDDPDTTRRMRYFNNFYGQFQVSEKFGFIAGFDIGIQQTLKGSSNYDTWLSPILISQFSINKKWKTAIRAEYYQDEKGVIIPTGTINGFQTTGVSLNLDYSPSPNTVFRIEGRWFNSFDPIFEKNNSFSNNNFFVATSIAIKFNDDNK